MIKKFGYTYEERQKIEEDLHKNNVGCWVDGKYHKGTPEQEKLLNIFDCISMLESLFAYGHLGDSVEELLDNKYLATYIKELGTKTVSKIITEQRKLIKGINQNIYIDSEGLSYNSITY